MHLKNFVLIIIMISLGFLYPIFAEEINPKDYIASPVARITTNMFGYNLIAKSIAQRIIKKELEKSIKGNYKVKLKSYSGIDLKKGIFKSLSINGKDISICDEFYISEMYIETTQKFNYIDYNKHPIQFVTDIPMKYSLVISEDNLNKSFKMDILNLFSETLPFVSFKKIQFKLDQDKLIITSGFQLPFGKTIKFSFASRLKVVNGKIILSDCETYTKRKEFADNLVKIINHYNFLENINKELVEGAKASISVKNVDISDKKIYIDGTIVLSKV